VVYLLHGLTGQSRDWGSIPGLLSQEGFRVFTFDMRGHGKSDKPRDGYGPEDHGRDVPALKKNWTAVMKLLLSIRAGGHR